MKIKDGLKLKGKPAEIPDTSRVDLPVFFKERGYKVGAEIGVLKGDFTKKFCDVGIKMYGIDPWRARGNRLQRRQDSLYRYTLRHLKEHIDSGLCEIIKKTSMEAVENFEDESLDFVYIDGNHNFRYVAEDLFEWTKKVKKGGVISGHDYAFIKKKPGSPDAIHVIHVLHAYINSFGIKNFYILGRKYPQGKRILIRPYYIYKKNGKEEKRDLWRSWFWIKE